MEALICLCLLTSKNAKRMKKARTEINAGFLGKTKLK